MQTAGPEAGQNRKGSSTLVLLGFRNFFVADHAIQIAKKYLHVQQIPKPDAHEPSLVPPFEVHSAAIKD